MRPLAVLLTTLLAGTAFGQVPPAAADQREPRLSGIIVTPDQRSAIFAFDQDGMSLIASEGTTIGPWTIVGITEHAVEVATTAGRTVVVPDTIASPLVPMQAPPRQPPTGDAMFDLRTP